MSRMVKKDGVWHKTSGNVDYSEIDNLKQSLNNLVYKVGDSITGTFRVYGVSQGSNAVVIAIPLFKDIDSGVTKITYTSTGASRDYEFRYGGTIYRGYVPTSTLAKEANVLRLSGTVTPLSSGTGSGAITTNQSINGLIEGRITFE